ncbi:MAG: hypothetical protein AAB402_01985 [Patescibacteria group bacterium]
MLTRDILYVSLAVAAVVATVFWVWLLWYIIRIFKSIEGLVSDFRDRLNTIDEILHTIREKLTSTHVQLSLLVDGLKQLMSFINNRRQKRAKSSKRASADEDDL